jgi:hypothetical protein
MYDGIDLSQVPNNPHAVGCYVDGKYRNVDEARRRFPNAHILTISTGGFNVASCYDFEKGDYSPDQASHCWRIAHDHGIWRPCMYHSKSGMSDVEANLHANGIPRPMYRKWQAHFDTFLTFEDDEDAKQFNDRALGRDLDESICRDGFFPAAKPPADRWMAAQVLFDPDDGSWQVHGTPAVVKAA